VECFSDITGVVCRVTIKQLSDNDDIIREQAGVYVQDLCRSSVQRPSLDYDLVQANTDFEVLFEGLEGHFLCNAIAALQAAGQYKNSHAVNGQPLGYNSTIVFPIRKVLNAPLRRRVGDNRPWHDLVGFLCIDAKESAVFHDEEVDLAGMIADLLFISLRPFLLPVEATDNVSDGQAN